MNIFLPAGSGEEREGCGYHCAVARSAFNPYIPDCCVFFSWSSIWSTLWLDQGIKAEKRKAEEKANPKKKAKAKAKGRVKEESQDPAGGGSSVVGVHPADLDEDIEEEEEEEPFE